MTMVGLLTNACYCPSRDERPISLHITSFLENVTWSESFIEPPVFFSDNLMRISQPSHPAWIISSTRILPGRHLPYDDKASDDEEHLDYRWHATEKYRLVRLAENSSCAGLTRRDVRSMEGHFPWLQPADWVWHLLMLPSCHCLLPVGNPNNKYQSGKSDQAAVLNTPHLDLSH